MQPVVGTVLGQLQQRPMFKPAVHRLQETIQRLGTTLTMQLLKRFERYRLRQVERPGLGSPQLGNVRSTAEQLADVFDQGADIGAFAACNGESRLVAVKSGRASGRERVWQYVLFAGVALS